MKNCCTTYDLKSYEKTFKALADEKRLEILSNLKSCGSCCVCDMTETFELSQSKLSYHLKILLEAELIVKVSNGTWNYYSINKDKFEELLSSGLIKDFCCEENCCEEDCCTEGCCKIDK